MSRVRAVAASFTDQDAANELVSSLEQSHRVIVSKKITNMVAIKFRVKCFNGSIKVQTITQPNSQFVDPSKLDDLEKMKKEYQSRVASVDSQLRSAQQGKLAAAGQAEDTVATLAHSTDALKGEHNELRSLVVPRFALSTTSPAQLIDRSIQTPVQILPRSPGALSENPHGFGSSSEP